MTRLLTKISVIVVRWNSDKFTMSKPCHHCIQTMRNLGIRKIYYSNDDGNFTFERLRDIHNSHVCLAHKSLQIIKGKKKLTYI